MNSDQTLPHSKKLIIIGIGSTGRRILNFVRAHRLYDVAGFAVNAAYKTADEFQGLPLHALEGLSERERREHCFFVAVQWNHLNAQRRHMYEECTGMGLELVNLISPLASTYAGEIRGRNCWIQDGVVLQTGAVVSEDTIVAAGALLGNDCSIGSHCFVGAHAAIGGMARIGEQTFVGINATVFPGTTVGRKCILGAATAIKRNVPDFSRYSTASDNIVIKTYTEEEVEDKLVSGRNIH
ncbi:MAG: hypothetical protein MJ056_02965 [Akkermansia sp.]|nr:hypothetical protein [Akkermansia sp.]